MTGRAFWIVIGSITAGLAVLWFECRFPRAWKAVLRAIETVLFAKKEV